VWGGGKERSVEGGMRLKERERRRRRCGEGEGAPGKGGCVAEYGGAIGTEGTRVE